MNGISKVTRTKMYVVDQLHTVSARKIGWIETNSPLLISEYGAKKTFDKKYK